MASARQVEQRKRAHTKWMLNGAIGQINTVRDSGFFSSDDKNDMTHAAAILSNISDHFSTKPTGERMDE